MEVSCPYRYVPSELPMNVTVYPNPVQRNAKVYIQVETHDLSLLENAVVDVYDTTGQHIGRLALNGQPVTSLDMPLKTGFYILKFSATESVLNVKLIVE